MVERGEARGEEKGRAAVAAEGVGCGLGSCIGVRDMAGRGVCVGVCACCSFTAAANENTLSFSSLPFFIAIACVCACSVCVGVVPGVA